MRKIIALGIMLLFLGMTISSSAVFVNISGDNHPPDAPKIPEAKIINPKEGYFHYSGIPLFPTILNILADTVSFGEFRQRPIQAFVTADCSGFDIEAWLYINDEYRGFGELDYVSGFFEWEWTDKTFGSYNLRVKARDIYGVESNWTSLDVWSFCWT